jgi:elongation factor P
MAISTADFKTGLTIELDGQVYQIVEFQHVKPGKGGAFVRSKLRQLETGNVLERTFRAGEKMEQALVERKKMEYLYGSGDEYVFMDMQTYDQVSLPSPAVGDAARFLQDNLEVTVVTHRERVLGIELPTVIEAMVTQTDPGLRGDTATGGSKPATIETGAVVQVPLFVNEGDRIRVDTRTGNYIERAK